MDTSEKASTIATWLGQQLGAMDVSTHNDFDRGAIVFRTRTAQTKIGDLEVSDEALADHSAETIVGDLAKHNVPQRLLGDPTMRLSYLRDRDVPHIETRIVHCDGRAYRFARDSEHNVRVYTSDDRLLEKLPSPLPVLPASLFRRSLVDLQANVRDWRGALQ